MVLGLPLKTVIELVFFALFVLIGIFVVQLFYGALFSEDSSLDVLHNRIEFIVCGAYGQIGEKNCTSNQTASAVFIAPARDPDTNIFFFNPHQLTSVQTSYVDGQSAASGSTYLGGDGDYDEDIVVTSPCTGQHCVCEYVPNRYTDIKKEHCIPLNIGKKNISFIIYDEETDPNNWQQITSGEISEDMNPANISLIKSNYLSWSDTDTNYYLLHLYYDANKEDPTLHIFPFTPNS